MSTHNMSFYEEINKFQISNIIKYDAPYLFFCVREPQTLSCFSCKWTLLTKQWFKELKVVNVIITMYINQFYLEEVHWTLLR